MHEIIRQRRNELGLSQADLATQVGVDKRQIRRYEAGETQPALSVAVAIAKALGVTVDELAGGDTRRVDLSGDWWACSQSWKDGVEVINPHQVSINQQGDVMQVIATTRGTPLEDGGYFWRGEMRLWDNEILMGWYVATESAVRSKGTMFFVLHQQDMQMTGKWVGLNPDGQIVSMWSAIAKTGDEVVALMNRLNKGGE